MYKSKQFQTINNSLLFVELRTNYLTFIVAVQKHPTRAPHTRMDAGRTSLIKMSHEAKTQLCCLCLQASELIRDDGPGLSATNICPDARR